MQFAAQQAQKVSAAPLCGCDVLEVSGAATVGKRGATGRDLQTGFVGSRATITQLLQ